MKKMKVDINDLSKERFSAMLERLQMGYPLKVKNMRRRDKEKTARLVEFYVKTTPPAKDILSGKAFRELFK
jgi:tRNA A37 N6-isopentenylltransferase MiaA